jgi:hypothetical protein
MKLYRGHCSITQYSRDKQDFIKNYVGNKSYSKRKYNKYMAFGDSLHITLAKFNVIKNPRDKTIELLNKFLKESWISLGYETIEEENRYFIKGLNIMKLYYEDPKDKSKEIIFVEEMITKELNNNTVIFGKVDKVFINTLGQLEVLDYKSSAYVNYALNPMDDSQLPLYLILVKHRLGYYPKIISYYYISKNIKVSYIVKQEDIGRLEKHFADTINEIQNDFLSLPQIS